MAVGRREWRNNFGAGTLFQRRPQGPEMHLVSALAKNTLLKTTTTTIPSKTSAKHKILKENSKENAAAWQRL